MDTIRIAVVGLGTRGTQAWIRLLQQIEGYLITAICDPITALHAEALSRIKNSDSVKTYSRYEDVLADTNVDAIALTVRCQEQGQLAAMALEAGKHVNSEVPAAHSIDDCWRIVLAQERSGRVYQLAEQCRYAGYFDAWKKLVADGTLGHITYCEGQYLHYYVEKCFQDPQTGQFAHPSQSEVGQQYQPTWFAHMPPIHYMIHDISPVLKVIDDRITQVVAMSTDSPSRAHPQLASPDIQVALMKSDKGALVRMAVSFAQPHPEDEVHWQQVIGTRGAVEWRRTSNDRPRMWLADSQTAGKVEMDWSFQRQNAPAQASESGHNDLDYYVHAAFRDAVLGVKPLEFDVYHAMDTAAPAILAAESITHHSQLMQVPSFKPSKTRHKGDPPPEII